MAEPGVNPIIGPAAGRELTGLNLWRRLRGQKLAVVAGVLVLLMALIALLVPVLPLPDPLETNYDQIMAPPSTTHWLGTDMHGRDQLSRVLWASRTSLMVGVVATGLALAGGVLAGGFAGYGGRVGDAVIMRAADIFLSFPIILGAIAIMAIFGPGKRNVFLAIAFFGWPIFARVFRAAVLSIKERGFVKAARVLGASSFRILFAHVLPNSVGPLISYAAMMVAAAIMAEAGLSYIHLGVQRPEPSWGLMLSESTGQFENDPWLIIVPGCAVTFTVLVFTLLSISVGNILDTNGSHRTRGQT